MSKIFREMEISESGANAIEAILTETPRPGEEIPLPEEVDFSWS
jgi:hypothetical protein